MPPSSLNKRTYRFRDHLELGHGQHPLGSRIRGGDRPSGPTVNTPDVIDRRMEDVVLHVDELDGTLFELAVGLLNCVDTCRRSCLLLLDVPNRTEEQPRGEVGEYLECVVEPHPEWTIECDLRMDRERHRRAERREHPTALSEHPGGIDDRDVVEPAVQQVKRNRRTHVGGEEVQYGDEQQHHRDSGHRSCVASAIISLDARDPLRRRIGARNAYPIGTHRRRRAHEGSMPSSSRYLATVRRATATPSSVSSSASF
jgi:hypothetical protein